jgi:hypothetical protein
MALSRGDFRRLAPYLDVSSTSIHALDLPIQFFALGSAIGMLAALIRHHRTGETEHWPVYVAQCGLALFGVGLLFAIWRALF